MILSILLFWKSAGTARLQAELSAKLLGYNKALTHKWALVEAATLITLIAYYSSGALFLLLLTAGCILFFLRQAPSKEQLINDLELSAQEQVLLDDPDAIVVTYQVTKK